MRRADALARFCHQYLQLERTLDYPSPDLLRESWVQEALYEGLFADGALPFPPPHRHRLRVLKELLRRVEESIDDWDEHGVSDNLMDSFAEMLAIPLPPDTETERETDYVTYHLSLLPHAASADGATRVLDNCVTLRESRRLIASAGATGFRTWEAGLHLGQYLCSNPELIRGKNVLELGTGTGYVSVVCAKYLGAARVVASDGSEDVLNGLSDTAFLNGLQGSQVLIPKELMWGNALVGTEEERWDGGEGVDVVLGADITYDTRAMPALIGTLGELFELYPGVKVIICTTERNVETLRSLLEQCKGAGMETTSVEFPLSWAEEQLGPFYATNVPIHIVEIRRGGV